MSNDTSVFPVALLENWIARGETPRNVNDARKHQESVNRKRLSTYFDASLLQIVTRPQADFRVLIRTAPILDYFRIADHASGISVSLQVEHKQFIGNGHSSAHCFGEPHTSSPSYA